MTTYLISFPSGAMQITPDELSLADTDAHQVVEDAKAAGVYVFGGGIDEDVAAQLVAADGSVGPITYNDPAHLNGGFMVIETDSREDAVRWAARTAAACRCPQELREFMYDPRA
ncbi:MAG: transcription initiation protein [Microbacteriaceae bacterium]|nr:transcription initiation protein [Microbacteriaceae bacterium]MCL2794068.1 transcription initiation protein [Microbacteriaceae bacterium]